MFRTATAAKPALSRRASLVESSEQIKIEAAVLTQLGRGLYPLTKPCLQKTSPIAVPHDSMPQRPMKTPKGCLIAHLSPSQNRAFKKSCGGSNQPSEAMSCLDSARNKSLMKLLYVVTHPFSATKSGTPQESESSNRTNRCGGMTNNSASQLCSMRI